MAQFGMSRSVMLCATRARIPCVLYYPTIFVTTPAKNRGSQIIFLGRESALPTAVVGVRVQIFFDDHVFACSVLQNVPHVEPNTLNKGGKK